MQLGAEQRKDVPEEEEGVVAEEPGGVDVDDVVVLVEKEGNDTEADDAKVEEEEAAELVSHEGEAELGDEWDDEPLLDAEEEVKEERECSSQEDARLERVSPDSSE